MGHSDGMCFQTCSGSNGEAGVETSRQAAYSACFTWPGVDHSDHLSSKHAAETTASEMQTQLVRREDKLFLIFFDSWCMKAPDGIKKRKY